MEILIGFCLTLLELAFILSGLLMLHGLRRILGTAPLFIALGVLLIFAQFAGAAGLVLTLGYPGLDYPLSSSMLTLPFLAILIVIYMTDGTLTAQQIIIGMMTALGCYVYLNIIESNFCIIACHFYNINDFLFNMWFKMPFIIKIFFPNIWA